MSESIASQPAGLQKKLKAERLLLTPRRYYAVSFFGSFRADTPIWSFYFINQGHCSIAEAGALFALSFLVLGISDLPLSYVADRYSRRAVVIVGQMVLALSFLVAILFPSYEGLAVSSILVGLGWAIESGASEAWLFDALKNTGQESRFEKVMSQSMALFFLGRSCAFAAAGFAYQLNPFLPYAMSLAAVLMTICILYGAGDAKREISRKWFGPLVADAARSLWNAKAARITILFFVASTFSADPLWSLVQPMMQLESHGAVATGLVFAAGSLSSVCGAQLFKRFSEKVLPNFILIYLGLSFISCLLIAQVSTFYGFLSAFTVVSLGWGAWWSAVTTIINHAVPSDRRATALSLFTSSYNLLFSLVTAVATALFASHGRTTTALFLATLAGILIISRLAVGPRARVTPSS